MSTKRATSVHQVRHDQKELGPTESVMRRSLFLLRKSYSVAHATELIWNIAPSPAVLAVELWWTKPGWPIATTVPRSGPRCWGRGHAGGGGGGVKVLQKQEGKTRLEIL